MNTGKCIAIIAAVWLSTYSLVSFAQDEAAAPEGEKNGSTVAKTLTLDEVAAKLQLNYQDINTYETLFDQEIYSMAQGRVMTKGAGTASYKKPGKMVWRYKEPEEHLYVTDGGTIWDYSPADKEAYMLPIKDALYKSFLLGLGQIKKDFEISFHSGRAKDKEGNYQLDLVPRDRAEREAIGTITIYIDPKDFLVRKTEMMDALGNRNRITFKDMKINPELEDSMFKFKPPPGVKVIETREIVPEK